MNALRTPTPQGPAPRLVFISAEAADPPWRPLPTPALGSSGAPAGRRRAAWRSWVGNSGDGARPTLAPHTHGHYLPQTQKLLQLKHVAGGRGGWGGPFRKEHWD